VLRAPGGRGSSARRSLLRERFKRRCAPGGTRHLPGGLGAGSTCPRQAIYTAATLSFVYEFMIYGASNDALRVRLLVFLELWLGTYPWSCGSG